MGLKNFFTMPLLIYLRELAKLQLLKNRPLIIGVTGSAGKTSLRNAIYSVLREKYKVKVSIKANSETGIPLNILGLKPHNFSTLDWLRLAVLAPIKLLTNWEKFEIYIAEMGVDSPHPPKNMEYLLTIIRPKIGVFLNAQAVHSEFFDSLISQSIKNPEERRKHLKDLISKEKGKLIESLPENGTAVLNNDDPRVKKFSKKTRAKVVTFSTRSQAGFMAGDANITLTKFSLKIKEKKAEERLDLNFPLDEHFGHTLLAAVAVGRVLGIQLSQCIKNLEKNFKLSKGRMSLIPGIKGTTILDSSYNASRVTMINALKLLKSVAPGRKVAVIGDMRELGEIGKLEHQEISQIASKTADLIITVGPLMQRWCVPQLTDLGFNKKNLFSVINPYQASEIARSIIKKGDTILVKGSQNNIFLEIVVEALMKNKKDADKLLCRREPLWDKKREALRKTA
jgi:UDP-N-acetylmuramyl pentapeptide synthase